MNKPMGQRIQRQIMIATTKIILDLATDFYNIFGKLIGEKANINLLHEVSSWWLDRKKAMFALYFSM